MNLHEQIDGGDKQISDAIGSIALNNDGPLWKSENSMAAFWQRIRRCQWQVSTLSGLMTFDSNLAAYAIKPPLTPNSWRAA